MEAGREARSYRTLQDAVGQATDRRAWNVIRLMFVNIPGCFCCCVQGAEGGNCRTRCLSPNVLGGLYVDRSRGLARQSRQSRVGSPAGAGTEGWAGCGRWAGPETTALGLTLALA